MDQNESRRLRQLEVLIEALSTWISTDDGQGAAEADFLPRPFSGPVLCQRVRAALDR